MYKGRQESTPARFDWKARVRPIQVVPPGENDASGPSTKFDEEWAPATAAQTIDGEVNLQIANVTFLPRMSTPTLEQALRKEWGREKVGGTFRIYSLESRVSTPMLEQALRKEWEWGKVDTPG